MEGRGFKSLPRRQGFVAQLVVQLNLTQPVVGSSPTKPYASRRFELPTAWALSLGVAITLERVQDSD